MLASDYDGLELPQSLFALLVDILSRYEIPDETRRVTLNCRDTTFYRTRKGLHPVEFQFKRDNENAPWQLVLSASFSYRNESDKSLDVEFYFHLANRWCYQPDAGAADLNHPTVLDLFFTWCAAFERNVHQQAFDDIQLTLLR
ncbi:hypothetical protein A1OQ_11610 [Enterovibrio norvegicus FF-162]|uniref:DUF2787 family protein n=1 Tax=Enterovibrio norvegicus TaxID=188144 RepID=UPI0003084B2E|nr:DUF2787 family protein [Enterovibrio norvegicus]OEE89419.1 hypothetical protein A1OQ_11610 [Enterovibrio norvegicus FF-162]